VSQRGLFWCIAGCLAWVWGWTLLLGLLGLLFTAFAQLPSAPDPSGPATGEEAKLKQIPIVRDYLGKDNELRIYRHGPWRDMVVNRALNVILYVALFWFLFAWLFLGCFLIGIHLVRRGVFHDPKGQEDFVRWLIGLGLTAGGILSVFVLGGFIWRELSPAGSKDYQLAQILLNISLQLAMVPLAIAYLCLLLRWAHSGRLAWVQEFFKAVGRMALTNYLMQTVLCTTIFYAYGLGWFGKLGHAAGLGVVAFVWLLELAWSPLWLTYFEMGPVEWLWRSVADGRLRPLLRRT